MGESCLVCSCNFKTMYIFLRPASQLPCLTTVLKWTHVCMAPIACLLPASITDRHEELVSSGEQGTFLELRGVGSEYQPS